MVGPFKIRRLTMIHKISLMNFEKVYVPLLSATEEIHGDGDALYQAWLETDVAVNNILIGAAIFPPDKEH